MSWKNTLRKMPMPLNTRATRDEEYKQAIIQYEKSVIEPKLVEFVRSKPATEGKQMTITFTGQPNDEMGETNMDGWYYAIGMDAYEKLGKKQDYILQIIGDLYRAEGYDVKKGRRFNGNQAIDIDQPNQGQ